MTWSSSNASIIVARPRIKSKPTRISRRTLITKGMVDERGCRAQMQQCMVDGTPWMGGFQRDFATKAGIG